MDIIDYSFPMQRAQAAIKSMHQSMLGRDYEQALNDALDAMVEIRMAYNAIRHEQETRAR